MYVDITDLWVGKHILYNSFATVALADVCPPQKMVVIKGTQGEQPVLHHFRHFVEVHPLFGTAFPNINGMRTTIGSICWLIEVIDQDGVFPAGISRNEILSGQLG